VKPRKRRSGSGSPFLVLARLRVLEIARSRASSFLFMGVPLLLLAVVGVTFWNGHPFERRRVAIVGNEGEPAVVERLGQRAELRLLPATSEVAAMGQLRSRMVSVVIVPRPDGGPRLVVGPREELFGHGLAGLLPAPAVVEVVELPRWGYVHYLFPGILAFTTLIAGLFGMGYPMVRYRQNLFLKKLATTPLPRSTFIASQIVGRAVLVLLQVGMLLVAARLLFDLRLTVGSAAAVIALTSLALLAFMGAGFALACVIKNEAVMVDAINSVIMPLVLLSEIFFSVAELPAPLPALSSALPTTQLVRLYRAAMLEGPIDAAAMLPGIAILVAWTVVTFGASLFAFEWHE
jgi:ABC-2 type transport system permease protein